MFSTVAQVARVNPFSAPHFQLGQENVTLRKTPLLRSSLSAASLQLPYRREYTVLMDLGSSLLWWVLVESISCGTTHTAVVPLDLVKCRIQFGSPKVQEHFNAFLYTLKEDGVRGLAKGWAPTFIGYSARIVQVWIYEVFKS
ncbi:hypothetical protein GDO81_010433 [Engystomops pustulosus]|uniref:Solute carrier family 25 member 3 n=1 Tax=Engystomops pustulosus TaxID=76066 RepID=A0AAV7BZY7_ENGPU|nr:hypothetical protein GDO81_010433 [Engystomops pustulosus]